MQSLALVLLIIGFLLTGVLGTETRLLFYWPGALLLGLAGLSATLRWRLRALFHPSDVCLVSVLAFVAYVIGRGIASPVAVYAREDGFIVAGALVVYGLTLTAGSQPRWRLGLVVTLLLLAVGNLGVGFIHLSGNWSFHVVPDFIRNAGAGRIGGFFANPNHLGAFFSMALFLTLGWLCFGRGNAAWKLWLAFLSVALTIGVALTVSRGALMGLAAGGVVFSVLALWVIWQTQRHLFFSLLIGGLVALGLAAAVLWKVNEEYLRGREESSPMAGDVRLHIWEAALTQHALSPMVGGGARQFYEGSIRYRSPALPVYAEEALFAHNEYLQMLADYGWVGLGLALLMLLAHGWSGLRYLGWFTGHRFLQTGRVLSNNLAFSLGALAAVVATLVHAVFEFHFHVAATALTGALLLGLLANPGIETAEHAPLRLPAVRLLMKLMLGAASLALLAGVWLYGRSDYALARSQIAQAKRDRQGQRAFLDQAIIDEASHAEAHYQRGLLSLEQMSAEQRSAEQPLLKQATSDLEQAVALNAHHYLYNLALADAYDALGRYDEALVQIQRALTLAPLHEESRLALGVHWHRLGRFEKAEMAYLWAGEARAWNEEGTTRWIDNYRLLLQHVALLRPAPTSKP